MTIGAAAGPGAARPGTVEASRDRRPRRSVHGRVLAAPDGLEPRRPPPGENLKSTFTLG